WIMSSTAAEEGCKVRVDDEGNKLCFLSIALKPILALYPSSIATSPCEHLNATTNTCPLLINVNVKTLPDLRSIKRKI
ncbi:MAG: hypothetical protein ACD_12C00381G0001, partial [uncultured bacterium]